MNRIPSSTLVWSALTLSIVLMVGQRYSELEAGSVHCSPPKAKRAATLVQQPAAPVHPAAAEEGFMGLALDVDEPAIVRHFGNQLEKLPEQEEFAFWYANYRIPALNLGGVELEVIFQMDMATDRLGQVLLRKMAFNTRSQHYDADAERLITFLTARHGTGKVGDDKRGEFYSLERTWIAGATTIHLRHSKTPSRDDKVQELLSIRYRTPE